MKRLRCHPTRVRREGADALKKSRDLLPDRCLEINPNENAHGLDFLSVLRVPGVSISSLTTKDTKILEEITLQQRPPHHLQCLLRRKPPDALAVTRKIAFDDLRSLVAG